MMIKKFCGLAVVGLPLIFAGCSGEEDMNAKMAQASVQAKQGKWEEAGKNAAKVSEAKPKEVAPKLLQALAYEKSGEYDKALDLARQSAEAAPDDFTAQYTLGRLAAKDKMRRSEAFTILERALELKENDRDTLVLLCSLGTELEHSRVIKYLHQLRTHESKEFAKSPLLRYYFGRYYIRTGNRAQAIIWLRSAVKISVEEKNWDLLLNCARCLDRSGFSPRDSLNFYALYRRMSGNRGEEYQNAGERISELRKQIPKKRTSPQRQNRSRSQSGRRR